MKALHIDKRTENMRAHSTISPKDRNKYGWAANPYVWVIEFERVEVTV